jgi:hypothetical protein
VSNALGNNKTGTLNVASGPTALAGNTTGHDNVASGLLALGTNTTGNFNIAIGSRAGSKLTTGSNNVDIANPGVRRGVGDDPDRHRRQAERRPAAGRVEEDDRRSDEGRGRELQGPPRDGTEARRAAHRQQPKELSRLRFENRRQSTELRQMHSA